VLFTPSTKARPARTTRTSRSRRERIVGADIARQVRDYSIALYTQAAEYAATKRHHHRRHQVRIRPRRERHRAPDRRILTPDSSRFWPADTYQVGMSPPSYDKQFVRDYLETTDWNKTAPAPRVPADVIAKTMESTSKPTSA
jgi:phosphoribosylaminoimidazole-succinocarboxamide synthase